RVIDDATLLTLARERPARADLVARTRGIGAGPGRRHAARIAETIVRCRALPPPVPPSAPPRDDARLARFEALRSWRRKCAGARGLEPDIVLGRDAIAALAELAPRTREQLEATAILDDWELEHHGDAIVAVLASAK
ncbi:MAG TPA: HRDC domain-containing protein, partial [Nannocystaceae bacterium]|nr:HRDC domain-containing protein [Nannocystaceae bacterium]